MRQAALKHLATSVRTPRATYALVAAAVMGTVGVVRGSVGVPYIAAAALTVVLVLAGPRGLRWAEVTLPFLFAVISYDLFGLIAHLRADVLVAGPHELERALFGVHDGDRVVVLAEYFATRTHVVADVICGAAYMLYLYFVIGISVLLMALGRERPVRVLGLAFLGTHLVAFVIWLVLPVAPPWYVMEYGLGPAHLDVPGSAAGAIRFDHFFGIDYFEHFYAQSRNPFGAVPSLHVAYPVLLAAAVRREHLAFRVVVGILLAAVATGAVYLGHHYVLDLLAGAAVALGCFAAADRLVARFEASPSTESA